MAASGYTGNPPGSGGGGGGDIDPSATVVSETSFGQSASAGNATAYSRGNHTHGTPAAPTAASVGADATGTAASALAAHVAAGDPHTQYLTAAEGSAAFSALGHTHAEADVTGLTAALAAKAPLASPTFTGTVAGITKTMVGLGNVDNTADSAKTLGQSQITNLTTDLAAKAPLASPTFTGVPAAPTAAPGTDTTQLATTAFVEAAVAAGGGGGGASPVIKRAIVTSGNITPQDTSGSWAALTGGPSLVIAAAVGDYLSAEIMGVLCAKDASTFYDLAVDAGGTLVRFGSNGTGTPATEGDPALYHDINFPRLGLVFDFVATSGDISGGNVTVVWAVKSAGSGTLYAGTFYPLRWRIINHGPVSVS